MRLFIGSLAISLPSWKFEGDMWIGNRHNDTSKVADALFDELRIDKIARTDDEIYAWYISGAPFYPRGPHRIAG